MTAELERLQKALASRYRVDRAVGRGGMATVYLAADQRHQRNVAIKVVRPDLAAVLGAERFLHEIRVTANLSHPHILPLYDSGVADGLLYYVMPFVVGESLRAKLNREGTIPLSEALAIAEDVADALSYGHRQGVVHRDVKPENVLLSEGHALVTDFGIAKAVSSASDEPLTRTGVAIGTPGYMSPEQAAGGTDVNQRTDVYSLACVIYEMLAGGVPSRWLSYEELEQGRFLRAPPAQRARLAELPDSVERALVSAMAIDPEKRFRTPNELFHALTAPTPPARRYSDTEAKDLLRRAASLEAAEPAATEDFSLTGIKRMAAEVDIPSRHVMAAADALEQPVAATTSRILGVPTGWQVSRTVAGVVPEREFPVLLDIVQETMGQSGVIQAALPGVFSWASAVGDEAKRAGGSAKVQVSPRSGRTKIMVSEDHTMTVAASVGVGLVMAGVLATFVGSTGAPPVILPALGLAGGGAVFFLRRSAKARRAKLRALLDRLTGHVVATGGPE
ncbi:MAG: serine/threonine protein kinase [Gemmatimonadota bacterium]|nr:serine/threonine protein kinase [Gemmatimonadota bacterium]MDH3367515.1 serine/threonine protein kinase [Gemmatimonadota bacterium]MDH3478733.1 serine/threonine protein kinase [Gemmatimonadota bacterium]MDH3569927.1 serine/threonine protein kinase [Gemmatimonadota bacterium]MDH5549595.1 serine/threonine protein kinase [Gemmatimonadota bacterium]